MSRALRVVDITMAHVHGSRALLAPVTAVTTLDDLVLFAAGPSLRVLSSRTHQILATERVFRAQTIHGITSTQHGDRST